MASKICKYTQISQLQTGLITGTQQVPQCKQRRVTYLLSTIYYVRNPAWIETTVCLYLLYICHTVIRRRRKSGRLGRLGDR
jgi:hypothetical protein